MRKKLINLLIKTVFLIALLLQSFTIYLSAQQSLIDVSDVTIFNYDGVYCNEIDITENSIAVSPTNSNIVLNVNNRIGPFGCGPSGLAAFTSTDGGNTWAGNLMIGSGVDPSAAIDLDDNLYILSLYSEGISAPAIWHFNGSAWDKYQIATQAIDKTDLCIDNYSANQNNMYAGWTNSDGQIEIYKSTTTDYNTTWSPSSNNPISTLEVPIGWNLGVNLRTGPNGDVYAVWSINDNIQPVGNPETGIGFGKSVDEGNTWTVTRIQDLYHNNNLEIRGLNGLGATVAFGYKETEHAVNTFPVMAVNQQNGDIYVVWANFNEPPPLGNNTGSNGSDIYFIKSTDGGSTWSTSDLDPPVRVNDDDPTLVHDQWKPWIDCDPVTGTIAVIFYDCRNDPNNHNADVYVALSNDEGETWQNFLISDNQYTPNAYAHEYIGIVANYNKIYPVWSSGITTYDQYSYPYSLLQNTPITQPVILECTPDLVYCNTDETTVITHKASNSIAAAGNGCTYTVENNANVIMHAGLEINLFAGVDITGDFDAYIDPDCSIFSPRLSSTEENNNPSSIFLYPNPTDNFCTIKMSNNDRYHLEMTDMYGKIILAILFEGTIYLLNVSKLSSSFYFIHVTNNNGQSVGYAKLVVQRY